MVRNDEFLTKPIAWKAWDELMAAVDEINTVNPTWRVERKKQQDAKDGDKRKSRKKTPGSQKNPKQDDGRPHIDEYA